MEIQLYSFGMIQADLSPLLASTCQRSRIGGILPNSPLDFPGTHHPIHKRKAKAGDVHSFILPPPRRLPHNPEDSDNCQVRTFKSARDIPLSKNGTFHTFQSVRLHRHRHSPCRCSSSKSFCPSFVLLWLALALQTFTPQFNFTMKNSLTQLNRTI